ncbi:hypothetical protein AX16_005695 [Volvariella volvacea WC 439]|nr:hypothetical protein AX16_005695 [Volvariella volvacea WC 439]
MVAFNKVFTSVFLAVVYSSVAAATALPAAHKFSTHSRRLVARGDEVETYHPPSTFETFGEGLEQPPSFTGDLGEETVAFIRSRLGDDAPELVFRSGYTEGEGRFAYVRQAHKGIPFANAVANVGWRGSSVVSFGASFVKPKKIASSKPTLRLRDVIPRTEKALGGKYNGHPATLEYLARPDGSAALVHVFQVQNDAEDFFVEAFVDAHTGELLSLTDFVAEATYRVLPIQKQAFPEGLETLVNPEDTLASPNGWHNDGSTTTTVTAGNNVVSYKTSLTNTARQTSAGPTFNYSFDDRLAPSVQSNLDAARVNAFYVINTVHDFTYRYGFTERAYNFQNNNFGRGGSGNDRVQISVQDTDGTNNANFLTLPDGQPGQCRMYIWTYTNPNRDGSLENDIIVHEMGHGVTNRMTGGGTGRCLQTTEARGLGEGWSDALAEWTEQKSATISDYVIGAYVTNNPAGIRTRPYSTSSTTNPQLYNNIAGQTSFHRIGEIWANTLHNVYAALVARYGFNPNARTQPEGTQGNVVFLHLFIDALAIQPCNPTFVAARAAWIQADQVRYGGANRCLLWRAFASKGLGVNARAGVYTNDFTIPSDC